MQDFLNQYPIRDGVEPPVMQSKIQNTLEQLEHDVTSIKTSLEKKRPKVSLSEINGKVNTILEILRSWTVKSS